MQYYSLDYGIKQIGRGGFPQARNIELKPGKMVTDDDFVWKVYGDRFPDFKPYIGTLILQKGSTVTDFISSAVISRGFVCSGKARGIIGRHRIANVQYYDLEIKHKDRLYSDYKLLHCVNNYVDKIDYKRSVFQKLRIENNTWVGQHCRIDTFTDYRELGENLRNNSFGDWQALEPVHIKFIDDYQPEHDIFTIWGINYKTYVSETLRSDFELNKITGLQYDFQGRHTAFG